MKPYDKILSGHMGGAETHFFLPYDPQCLLPNFYGADFMTPKVGHFMHNIAYGHPSCLALPRRLIDESCKGS